MEPHWEEVANALSGIAQEGQGHEGNSFSIRFVKSTLQQNDVIVSRGYLPHMVYERMAFAESSCCYLRNA